MGKKKEFSQTQYENIDDLLRKSKVSRSAAVIYKYLAQMPLTTWEIYVSNTDMEEWPCIQITNAELADLVNLSAKRVSRLLKQLKDNNLIEIRMFENYIRYIKVL